MTDINGNTGIDNTGGNNSGDMNSGNRNSGHWNSGGRNSGDWNSGNRNSGNRNSGDWNSGNRNSGNRNSGDWNSGDMNSGYMNSDEPTVRMFNKDTNLSYDDFEEQDLIPDYFYFDNNDWINSEDMTDEEKAEYPEHETTGGYVKVLDYYQAWRRSWDKASDEDRRKTLSLPNWNNEIFKEITGIDVEMALGKHKESEDRKRELLKKSRELIDKANELKLEAEKL